MVKWENLNMDDHSIFWVCKLESYIFRISSSWSYAFELSKIFEIFRVNRILFPSFLDVIEAFEHYNYQCVTKTA